jgi:hypothetical protein
VALFKLRPTKDVGTCDHAGIVQRNSSMAANDAMRAALKVEERTIDFAVIESSVGLQVKFGTEITATGGVTTARAVTSVGRRLFRVFQEIDVLSTD